MADNPLTLLYASIWTSLGSKADFVALFPANTVHQVRYDTALEYAVDPDIETPAPADYPMCRVTMTSTIPSDEGDSSASYLDVSFAIEVCTGQQHQSIARDAAWSIFRAMKTWRTWVRSVVTYNSVACVADVRLGNNQLTDQNQERNRGTNQWIIVWSATAKLYFTTTDLETL